MFPSLRCKLLISYKFNALHMESKDNELHVIDSGDLNKRARIIAELAAIAYRHGIAAAMAGPAPLASPRRDLPGPDELGILPLLCY
ncbi:hypothetical protein G113_12052 [Aeromonas molluscorum 848]|uniref:Uncharacterized protein n=1 Tax=Aeromonas molluscorum 848 TaxID=1268236 RepID=R1H8W3_9GAMM|nr:hypothetical protein G113_12052 [Aeromonas molluscorum 848]